MLHETALGVADVLRAAEFSKDVNVGVRYKTDLWLEDVSLDAVHVDIVAAYLRQEADSRGTLRNEVGIDIAVRYKFSPEHDDLDGNVAIELAGEYLGLLEELADELADPSNRELERLPAKWLGNEIRLPWDPEAWKGNRQYTGIMQATYQVSTVF